MRANKQGGEIELLAVIMNGKRKNGEQSEGKELKSSGERIGEIKEGERNNG